GGEALARHRQGLHRRVAAGATEFFGHDRRVLGPVAVRVDDRVLQTGVELPGLGLTAGEHVHLQGTRGLGGMIPDSTARARWGRTALRAGPWFLRPADTALRHSGTEAKPLH